MSAAQGDDAHQDRPASRSFIRSGTKNFANSFKRSTPSRRTSRRGSGQIALEASVSFVDRMRSRVTNATPSPTRGTGRSSSDSQAESPVESQSQVISLAQVQALEQSISLDDRDASNTGSRLRRVHGQSQGVIGRQALGAGRGGAGQGSSAPRMRRPPSKDGGGDGDNSDELAPKAKATRAFESSRGTGRGDKAAEGGRGAEAAVVESANVRDVLRASAKMNALEQSQRMAREMSSALGLPERSNAHRQAAEAAARKAGGVFVTGEVFLVSMQRIEQLEEELAALKAKMGANAATTDEEQGVMTA